MKNISETFQELKKKNEIAFVPFLTIGDPNPELFLEIVTKIEPYADYLEFGIPFSDPIADGPVILAGNLRAQQSGINLSTALELLKKIRKITEKPIIILTYANILGVHEERKETIQKLHDCGVNGVIVADVPFIEAKPYLLETKEVGLDLILLATPTTSEESIKKIIRGAQGFLYVVSVKGITGVRTDIQDETKKTIENILNWKKGREDLPIFVGFGISEPSHVIQLKDLGADGVIVGSALVRKIEQNISNPENILKSVEKFVKEMKEATIK